MSKLDLGILRPKLDLDGKYVDFGVLRTSLSVAAVVKDLETNLTAPTKEGECRATCPKCRKERSFALNVNTNRFNCFGKACILKGGGVIDLIAKLWEVPAKEASHLLACAYGIQPYTSEPVAATVVETKTMVVETPPSELIERRKRTREMITRDEFDELYDRVERLSHLVWSQMFENGEIREDQDLFDDRKDYELEAALSG